MMTKTSAALAAALLLGAALPGRADDGHGHDEAPAASAAPALPRFALAGARFELVGVLDGRHLTLYLDRADSNAPVAGARLNLQWGPSALRVEAGHAEGEYEAELAALPEPGDIALRAEVATAEASERLAGTLELHEPDADHHADGPGWRRGAAWAGSALLVVAAGALALRRKLGARA